MTNPIVQAENHLAGAIDSYEFIKKTFYEHLDSIGERENEVLKKARESVDYFKKRLEEVKAEHR